MTAGAGIWLRVRLRGDDLGDNPMTDLIPLAGIALTLMLPIWAVVNERDIIGPMFTWDDLWLAWPLLALLSWGLSCWLGR